MGKCCLVEFWPGSGFRRGPVRPRLSSERGTGAETAGDVAGGAVHRGHRKPSREGQNSRNSLMLVGYSAKFGGPTSPFWGRWQPSRSPSPALGSPSAEGGAFRGADRLPRRPASATSYRPTDPKPPRPGAAVNRLQRAQNHCFRAFRCHSFRQSQ